jgi:UDP-glucuronate 4-epimerase
VRILLTGGAGFIGSTLLERLLPAHAVTVLDDFNDYYDPALKRANLRGTTAAVIEGDLRDPAVVTKAFDASKPEGVIHLAARAGVRPSIADPALYSSVNVAGTLGLLEACRRRGVKRFLFASSSSVYGDSPDVPYREDDGNLRPISPYGVTKLLGEHYVRVYARLFGMRATCLRFFTAYGPRQRPDMAIHLFARKILAGEEITMYGDGTTRRDYTYVDDIVDGLVRAFGHDEEFGVYNLGESRTVELRELIAILEKVLGVKAKVRRLPEQPGDVKQTFADVSRAKAAFGYSPGVGIEEGLTRFAAWMRGR